MALDFARTHILTRSSGHTVVKAAAYRAGARLWDERAGFTADYTHRASEVRHSEVLLPDRADPALLDRERLWSAVEDREDQHSRRASAQLAKDHIIALPRELSPEQQTELAVAFAREEFVSRGLVVDLAVHDHSEGNPHAHLLTTTRVLEGGAFAEKDRGANGRFANGRKVVDAEQLRHRWAAHQLAWCKARGIDIEVRSNDGADYPAEIHLGPTKAMETKGEETTLVARNAAIRGERARLIVERPEIVIERVSRRKSLFGRHDLYREAHALIDDPEAFAQVKAKLDVHPELEVILAREDGPESPLTERLTTRAVIALERAIRESGERLGVSDDTFAGTEWALEQALARRPMLSEEQIAAARHLRSGARLAIVAGLAGAGKSTMLDAVRESYARDGHRVQGIALAGKAADELTHSAGIESRTIAAWLMALEAGRETVNAGDVVVLDEGGMVDNRTMRRVLHHVEQGGAKLIVVGDAEQLQAIQAGCPFRDLSETVGYAEIATIRRQTTPWQRQATRDLARGRTTAALAAYEQAGCVRQGEADVVQKALVSRYLERPSTETAIVLAHRNVDVRALNERIREERKALGELAETHWFGELGDDAASALLPDRVTPGDRVRLVSGEPGSATEEGVRATVVTADEQRAVIHTDAGDDVVIDKDNHVRLQPLEVSRKGMLELAIGDRVLFTRNDSRLGVKNGLLGSVVGFEGATVQVARDDGGVVGVDPAAYHHLSHGYATTVHKAQGVTVDRAYLLGSASMDKHLAYVGMSRHRHSLEVFLPEEQFRRRSFASVIAQTNRQESALAFAEQHGLVVDTDTGRLVDAVSSRPERAMSELNETAVVDPPTAARPVQTEPPLPEAVEPLVEEDVAQARRAVERVAREHVLRLEREHRREIGELEQVVEDSEGALARHEKARPRRLLGAKKALATWEKERGALRQRLDRQRLKVDARSREFAEQAEARQALAQAQAKRDRPEAAALLERHERRALAHTLRERWQALEWTRGLETDLRERLRLEGEIHELVERLDGDKSLARELPASERQAVAAARTRTDRVLAQVRERDRGRSR